MIVDEWWFCQVLFNLIFNVVCYFELDGVVDVSCVCDDEKVMFVVKDYGLGILVEILIQVFNWFVGYNVGVKCQGVGFGFVIVKSFVELYGGLVDIDLVECQGIMVICIFFVYL